MRDLEHREHAQLGLQHIEDAIVGLLTQHESGMPPSLVADALGLEAGSDPARRDLIAAGILELLVKNGRIQWNEERSVYVDNPDRL
jgi:hypothetical protein